MHQLRFVREGYCLMSDFLSNFTNDNYGNKQPRKKERHSDKSPLEETSTEERTNDSVELNGKENEQKSQLNNPTEKKDQHKTSASSQPIFDEDTQTITDPTYRKKQIRKKLLIAVSAIIVLMGCLFAYYQFSTVKVPDFVGKNVSEVREWGVDSGVKISPEQVYDFDEKINAVVKQNQTAGKRMKKKDKLIVQTSLGPDPKELIALPTFEEMTITQAQEWIESNKAENVTISEEYNDKVAAKKLIKQEFSQKDFDKKKYKREDQMILTYSKGKEVFEKNIAMPDFKKKDKGKLDEWVKANEIKATVKWVDSDEEKGKVLTQSVEPTVKVAKRECLSFTISKGKPIIVPDFSLYNKNTVEEITGLTVQVNEKFSDSVSFGGLLSQSVEAGKKYYEGEPLPTITVEYSVGQPYLRSYIGELEGDLAERFFNDYQSKGANITYTTYRTPSSEPKGTVVKMSLYNEFVSTDYHVSIGISDGSKASEVPKYQEDELDKELPETKDSLEDIAN
ncbi:PASTA domain-containing protein [Vagococcus xieshaowenii]|nr:PASTA domain-containing protein [Vagococcus xieshaowenii]